MPRICHTGTHTEYCGPGRVRFISFFGGAGYCLPLRRGKGWGGTGLNIRLPGFTLYFRTRKSRAKPYWGNPVRWLRLTRNPNRPVV